MRKIVIVALGITLASSIVSAQSSLDALDSPLSEETATTSRSYESEPTFDAKAAIVRRAQLRSEARRQRLESQAWFGYSKLRPPANPTPFMSTAAPHWAALPRDPYRWPAINPGHAPAYGLYGYQYAVPAYRMANK
ncbi:MAG: hypothetical protein R3C28_07210 [Pirellulaceae bacterium]